MRESHYCWMDPEAFPGRLIVPRSDPDQYEQSAGLLFDTADEAIEWRDEELDNHEDDADETTYIRQWVLCTRTVETVAPPITPPIVRTGEFTARFSAQVWLGNHALEVDPQGDTEWDCTDAWYALLPDDYQETLLSIMDVEWEALDTDDLLRGDVNAPEWVQNWSGPFSIWVRRTGSTPQ